MIQVDDDIIKAAMQGVIDEFLIPKFISLGMNASGKWIESLQADAIGGVGYIRGLDYTWYLANGRSNLGDAPPVQPLISWVGNKFGLYGEDAKRAAFAIRHKIKEKGTDYYPQGTDLLEVLDSIEVQQYLYTKIGLGMRGKLRNEIMSRVWRLQN